MAKKMMLEEKRTKILELFEKYKTFFKIQELEKLGSKEKGIVENTIKDVVLGLFYDDLISSEKVGTGVFYWSNSNKKLLEDIKSINKLEIENEELKSKINTCKKNIKKEKEIKQITELRLEKLQDMERLKNNIDFITEDLSEYSDLTKEEFIKKEEGVGHLVDGINKITDNLFVLQDYISKKFNMEKKEINRTFNIEDEMDYVI